jgi:DNA-binding IclR family transcriptional regulator
VLTLHATANGKVLLLALDDDQQVEMLGRMQSYTDSTITTRERLRKELAKVREQGYAVAIDELEVGLAAIAAPIHNAHGDVIASMSVSGPTFRLTEERIDEIIPPLVEAAAEVSHRLGWGHR